MSVHHLVRRAIATVGRDLIVRRWRLVHRRELALFERYRDSTMVPEPWFVDSLLLARRGAAAGPGDLVECGTWRGGMSAAIAEYVGDSEHQSVLFDSFEGLPDADPVLDGQSSVEWQRLPASETYDNCTAAERDAHRAMAMTGRPHRIVKGWFDETLSPYAAEGRPIVVLRIDSDWYESTTSCLRALFDLVIPGGVLILDDYGTWEGCTRAVHDFLSSTKRSETIERTRGGVYSINHR